jgi:3-oxoacyl-[acyl-carrier-protein] synthase-3
MDGIRIISTGKALPERKVPNAKMSSYVETSDEWISSRTGIKARYFSEKETSLSLSADAARQALERAGLSPEKIDLCIVATITPDYATPSVSCLLQKELGLREDIPCFDINAACSGFVYALHVAAHMMNGTGSRHALVIGCEQLSRILDLKDRSTCVLFGDGAGACVAERAPGIGICGVLGAQGDVDALHCCGQGRKDPFIRMDGRAVFRFAVTKLEETLRELERCSGVPLEKVDYFACHQANERILRHVQRKMKIPEKKMVTCIADYGNTSGASIPILLDEMACRGLLKKGTKVFAAGFGGGLTYAGIYLEMDRDLPGAEGKETS